MAAVLVNLGKQIVTSKIGNIGSYTASVPSYIGWGTGAGTAAVADTDLFTPIQARVLGTMTQQTTTTTNDTLRNVGTITADAARTITNVGTWDGAGTVTANVPAGANLFIHADHASVSLASGDSIQYTVNWQLT